MRGFISGLSILFHWSIFLSLCQYLLSWWLWLCSRAWVRQVDSSSTILLSQDCFGYSGFFVFPYKLWFFFFSSTLKNTIGSLIGIAFILLLWVQWLFLQYWFFQSKTMVYLSICLHLLWFLFQYFAIIDDIAINTINPLALLIFKSHKF